MTSQEPAPRHCRTCRNDIPAGGLAQCEICLTMDEAARELGYLKAALKGAGNSLLTATQALSRLRDYEELNDTQDSRDMAAHVEAAALAARAALRIAEHHLREIGEDA